MAGPVTLHVRHRPSTAAVEVWIVASADAGICRVEVVECCGQWWQRQRQRPGLGSIVGGMAVFPLGKGRLGEAVVISSSSSGGGGAVMAVIVRGRIWIGHQGHGGRRGAGVGEGSSSCRHSGGEEQRARPRLQPSASA